MIPERQNHAADRRGEAEPRRVKFRPRTVFVATLSVLGLFGCDQTKTTQGGSADETSTIAFYRPDGKPAAGARVMIYGTADTGASPRDQVITNANGSVELPALGKGFYNLVVRQDGKAIFQDSLFSNGERMLASSDTLRATGVLAGRVRVQSQHSPRIAWIHLLGAGKYLNVDDSGFFRMEGIPQGKFTMAALTREGGYTPTFKEVRAVSDSVVDVGDIELVYTGLPVIKNLEARFDTLTGIVNLRWDSIGLRQTWHYNIYRDDILLGRTTGSRWIDTVSDEYPGSVPSQGVHTYHVRLANADSVGSKWESITMRIISAYLYQEVKIDWEKKAELPWKSAAFQLDTLDGKLVAWRSAEYQSQVTLPGETVQRTSLYTGAIEMWTSTDTGRTWTKIADSLPIGTFPVRYLGKWWGIRKIPGAAVPFFPDTTDGYSIVRADVGHFYENAVVVSSLDGLAWDSVATLPVSNPDGTVLVDQFRMETDADGIWAIGSTTFKFWWSDIEAWRFDGTDWKDHSNDSYLGRPGIYIGMPWARSSWDKGWWSLLSYTHWEVNGKQVSAGMYSGSVWNGARVVALTEDLNLVFAENESISADDSVSVVHTLSYPGGGRHYERLLGGRVVSVSDSGVHVGRILSGTEGGDPRGTWVKRTEIPAVF
jgi:hypothetical protein